MIESDGGILIIDKEAGITSAKVVSRLRRLLGMKRVGHTGTLDPFATGVLPVCFGRATSASAYMLNWDKRYLVDIRLGYATTTMDTEGTPIEPMSDPVLCRRWLLEQQRLTAEVERLSLETKQQAPMYSAVKHQGKPLYEYARKGIEIERPARPIQVIEATMQSVREDDEGYAIVSAELHVSSGTYIRSLADLLGHRLGCGAHASALRRLTVGHFELQEAVSLNELEALFDALDGRRELFIKALTERRLVRPVADVFSKWPSYQLEQDEALRLANGQSFACSTSDGDEVAFLYEGRLIAVGAIIMGQCHTKRVFVAAETIGK